MIDKELNEQIIRQKNEKIKTAGNRTLIVFIIVFLFGYLFFFTSNLWMPASYNNVKVTPLLQSVEGNSRKVTLISWTYSRDEMMQEVVLEIQNGAADGVNKYDWSAMQIGKGFCEVKKVVEEADFVVLHLKRINPRWSEISLRMDADVEYTLNANEGFKMMKFYTSAKAVEKLAKIPERTEKEYRIMSCQVKIDDYNSKISELRETIRECDEMIGNADVQIEELKSQKEYQTKSEWAESSELISLLESKKSSFISEKNASEKSILELDEKIKIQQKKMEDLQS